MIIGHTFPEPATTAAGSRVLQLMEMFRAWGYTITFASTATFTEKSYDLKGSGFAMQSIRLNHDSFDIFLKELMPEIVIFDRYLTEEQFGWRVTENCPDCIKILDTEDLHFLRKAREEAIRAGKPVAEADLFSETAKRELASILRCDLSLIISEDEMELLQDTFHIPAEILFYLPFLVKTLPEKAASFEKRAHFMAIGNLLHAPNVDAVVGLAKIWPKIKQQLPSAQLHIYGAYAPKKIQQLDDEKNGFLIKGWAPDLEATMVHYRVQLAPLRFGAGLKGKLVDAMRLGLPTVTTEIGAEGMCGALPFGGILTTSTSDFAEMAVKLYTDDGCWKNAQNNGFRLIRRRFGKQLFEDDFREKIHFLRDNLSFHRRNNFMGQILQHHTLRSTKYMAKWISAKNKLEKINSKKVD